MDSQSRRSATLLALAQVAATLFLYMVAALAGGVFRYAYGTINEVPPFAQNAKIISLCLLPIPMIWLYAALCLQGKPRETLLSIVFYSGFFYVVFLLIWIGWLFVRLFSRI